MITVRFAAVVLESLAPNKLALDFLSIFQVKTNSYLFGRLVALRIFHFRVYRHKIKTKNPILLTDDNVS